MKNNPDNRKDNVEHLQKHINHTIQNMELADELIEKADNDETKKDLIEKNKRREKALDGFKHEIKDEADARRNGYK